MEGISATTPGERAAAIAAWFECLPASERDSAEAELRGDQGLNEGLGALLVGGGEFDTWVREELPPELAVKAAALLARNPDLREEVGLHMLELPERLRAPFLAGLRRGIAAHPSHCSPLVAGLGSALSAIFLRPSAQTGDDHSEPRP